MRSRRAAFWTAWWATRFLRCCGTKCGADFRPAACKPWRCAWWWSASANNEITKKAVQKAFEKPSQVNVNLVDAQQARRVLDRLVGYKISPLLWDKVRRGEIL